MLQITLTADPLLTTFLLYVTLTADTILTIYYASEFDQYFPEKLKRKGNPCHPHHCRQHFHGIMKSIPGKIQTSAR